MRTSSQNYARIALAISILAAFGSIVYAILVQKFDLYLQVGIGLVIIGIALFALLDPHRIRELLTGRQIKYSSNMLVFTVGLLAVLVVVNVLADRFGGKWDFTEDRTNSLTSQTVEIIQNLPGKADLIGFFSSEFPVDSARQLLENLKENSKGSISYRR